MRFAYDKQAKALYVTVANRKVAKTKELSRNFLVDVDTNGNIIGVELLGAEAVRGKDKVRVLVDLAR